MTSTEQRKQDARRRGELKLKACEIRIAALRTARGVTTPSYEVAVVETEGRVREARSLDIDWSNYDGEQRSSSGGMKTIRGVAAVYNSPSLGLGGFTERIQPGAFRHSIASKRDVRCLRDHDDAQLLGRTTSGTLTLNDSPTGLGFSCLLPETNAGRDVQALIERRDISQCSFGMMFCLRDDWDVSLDGEDVRTILDADVYDVSCVASPAYPATSCSVRSIDQEDEMRLRQMVVIYRRAGKKVPQSIELRLAQLARINS
jgi:HK97 family phage prohead protease